MSMPSLKQCLHLVFLFALTLASGTAAADDTEIYFSTGSSSARSEAIRPNVLLILDTSGSMSSTVSGTGQTRMQIMKDAMDQILDGMQDVNVGLMRFTNDDGGPVLFPVTYIDAPAADVVSEPDDTQPSYTYTIDASSDDAEENTATGDVVTTDPVLDISQILAGAGSYTQRVTASSNDADEYSNYVNLTGYFWADQNGNTQDAARFTGVTVPQGATITNATFSLTPASGTGGSTTLAGHDVDNSPAFTTASSDISTRTKTTANVTWNFADTTPESRAVTGIIQEIVNRPGWSLGNALSIISYNSTGTRYFYSYDTGSTRAPQLTIDYTTSGVNVDQLTGLRFSKVDIPQGATVTSARLVLTPTSTQSGAAGEQWIVKGEDSDNAATFAAVNGNISSRTTTSNSVAWNVPDTTVDTPVTSPDLTAVVQEIVDRSGWCGGNAMTFLIGSGATPLTRYFHSFEGDAAVAPTLEVSYDGTSSLGCYRRTETAQISADYDDAEEDRGTMQRGRSTLILSDKKVGLRFLDLDIPQGATILSANIEFNSYGTSDRGNPTVDINAENVDNSAQFTGTANDISNRALTTATASWNLPAFASDGIWYSTPDIRSVVQEVVNRSGWTSGNAMSFIFDTSSQLRAAKAHDTYPNQAPRISITYEATSGAISVKTVRERLKELVNVMPTSDWTPIVETLYEGAHYWRGQPVKYGLTRDNSRYTRISHPGSYCDAPGSCNGATTTGLYSPYGINNPSGCDPSANPDDYDCRGQTIKGTPSYISPFNSTLTCQSNYQVLLTDGEANSNDIASTIRSEYLDNAACQSTKSDGTSISSGEQCGIDLARFMYENDQSSTLSNDQLVATYTIGFNTSGLASATQYLKDMADAGSGQFFEASTASDLVSVFDVILSDVKSDPTSFVSPSLATNAFNRLLSRDEIYFGLFTPSFEQGWPGNVKKYNICVDTTDYNNDGQPDCTLGEILDQNGNGAIDATTDKFKDTAQSVWSSSIDGRETVKGGVGAELTDYTTRVLYTDTTSTGTAPASGTSLAFTDNPGYQIDINTWDDSNLSTVRGLVCPTPSTTAGSDCESRMLWLLGKSVSPSASDTSATTRWTVNDVLHSSPAVITYGGSDSNSDGTIDTFFDRLVVGTNDGGVRFINATTGKEEWEFIPQETLQNQPALFVNAEGDHIYGLDVTPTLDVNDVDGDGFIEPTDGDYVHIIVGMRRGGDYIYALDVTPDAKLSSNTTSITPKFLWRINSSTTGYSRLAQTWSQPRMATIQTTSGYNRVMIFGGGYDANLDGGFGTAATSGSDNIGNAIYIADPADGSLIMSISGSGSGANIIAPNMHYSIPSRITVLDTDGDGIDDRLYVGDTGGQVWRVDLNGDIKLSGSGVEGSTVVGRLAAISSAGGSPPVNERRIFEPPSVVQVKDSIYSDAANGEYDYVMVGTGNRAHPLDEDVANRMYAFRDKFIDAMPDSDSNNLADSSYPQSGSPITNADLVDVSTTVLDTTSSTKAAMGWYFNFDSLGTDGEKILSAPTTIAGAVFFTTYVPEASISADLCAANIGGGNAYNLNVLTTKAAIDWDEDGTLEDTADRKKTLGGGIPSDVVPVFTKEGVVGVVGVEGGASQLGALTGLPRYRTYWYEEK